MTIKIWQSYSCNNSSSYRLIARFADATSAKSVARELEEFFAAHALEVDARERFSREPTDAQRALAAQYGFRWTEVITWGDEGLEGDEPDVIVHDETMIVFHSYCGGGLGDGVPNLLAARGAAVEAPKTGDVEVSLVFLAARDANPELEAELATVLERIEEWEDEDEEDPLDKVGEWLRARGITKSTIQIGRPELGRVFRAIHKARCTSCGGPLDYLEPRLHDLETPQLMCRPCGGLYELTTFLPEATT